MEKPDPRRWRLPVRLRLIRRNLGRRLARPDGFPGLEVAVAGIALLLGIASYAILTGQRAPATGFSPSAVTLLLVANLVPLLALLILIGRRIAILIANRRAGRAGARLHVRLVALFAALSAAPTIVVVIFASLLFQFGVQFWFSDRARTVLDNADRVAQAYVQENQARIVADIEAMARDITLYATDFGLGSEPFRAGLAFQLEARDLSEAAIFRIGANGPEVIAAIGLQGVPIAERIGAGNLAEARADNALVLDSAKDRIESVVPLGTQTRLYLYTSRLVEPRVLEQVARTQSALTDYKELTDRSRALQWRFNIILLVVSLIIVAVSVWAAILLATRLVAPIAELSEAAERVGTGDFDVRVPVPAAGDEIGALTRAFNRMTGELKAQQAALISASTQAETRRRFTEAVLSGVSAGVLSIDQGGIIRLANASAEALLDCGPRGLNGRRIADVVPEFAELLETARAEGIAGAEVTRPRASAPAETQTFAVRLTADAGEARSYILTFDDISQQLSDQRRAAWSDVARRVAHEIKNPLTPIVLAAERLRRRFTPQSSPDAETFANLTDTIIRQVGDLRRMVDEFSAFARMPAPTFRPENIPEIARQAMFLATVAQPDIRFRIEISGAIPEFVCDRRQIGQVFTNLLKNASEAVQVAGGKDGEVVVSLRAGDDRLTVDVSDTGVGLPPELRDRLTEPYVTTRARGTGLGLAIVKRIVEDHHGRLDLMNRAQGGATARIEFDLAANRALAGSAGAESEPEQVNAPHVA